MSLVSCGAPLPTTSFEQDTLRRWVSLYQLNNRFCKRNIVTHKTEWLSVISLKWSRLLPSPTVSRSQARDIYEEAIQTVTTVRDFGQVFDAYAQFEESMINAKMETITEAGLSEEGETSLLHGWFVANDLFLLPHLFSLVQMMSTWS